MKMFSKISLIAILAFSCAFALNIPLEEDSSEFNDDSLEFQFNHDEYNNEMGYWDLIESDDNLTFSNPDMEKFSDPFLVNGSVEYPVEEHTVKTSDGYILKLHRIPTSAGSENITVRRPVFLMHGLLDSSAGWVLAGHTAGLAYMLADRGYDVWMGNARGNRYSRSHTVWNPKGNRSNRKNFWNFSWHQIGTIDLPTMIDYVLSATPEFKKLHYIAHSQGTTAFFVMASQLPQYNSKIILMNALAPIAYMTNAKSPIAKFVAKNLDKNEFLVNLLGKYEFLPGDDLLTTAAAKMCRNEAMNSLFCTNTLFLLAGFNSELFDSSQIPLIMQHIPSGSSTYQIIHYGQLMKTNRFCLYNYGAIKNLKVYGSLRPPIYNLDQIYAPVALHYGRNDLLASVDDVLKLAGELPNLFGLFPAPHPRFNHIDFLFAKNIRQLVYEKIIILMKTAERDSDLFE